MNGAELVFFSPSRRTVIDMVGADGRSWINKQTLAEIQERYPDAVQTDLDNAAFLINSAFRRAPKVITREQFWEALECLPPDYWERRGETESFQMCELTCGNITNIYCRIGEVYYSLADDHGTNHDKIVAACRAVQS